MRKERPNILVVQEIKTQGVDRFIPSIWKSRFIEWFVLSAVGRSWGIFVVWDTILLSVKNSLLGMLSMSIEIENDGITKRWFSVVYGRTVQIEGQTCSLG